MKLDSDLQALVEKLDQGRSQNGPAPLDDSEHALMHEAIHASQHQRDTGDAPGVTPLRRELDFFLVCVGYGLIAFALLMVLRWSAATPLGGPGVFGLAFLVGAAGAAFRHYYLHQPNGGRRGLVLTTSAVAIVLGLLGILAANAIGGVMGIVLGAVFYRALGRHARSAHQPAPSENTEPG